MIQKVRVWLLKSLLSNVQFDINISGGVLTIKVNGELVVPQQPNIIAEIE